MASMATFKPSQINKHKLTDAVLSSPCAPCSLSPAFQSHILDSPIASSISIEDLNVLDGPDALRFFEEETLLIDDSSLFHGNASSLWHSHVPFDDQNGPRELDASWSLDELDGLQHTSTAGTAAPACMRHSLPSVSHCDKLDQKESFQLSNVSPVSLDRNSSAKLPQLSRLNSTKSGLKHVHLADSDGMDDHNDGGCTRTGRTSSSRNIFSERKRRRELNERLYSLRSLVPKISKMDKASIVNDAIDHVRNLQRLVEVLQDEVLVLQKKASGGIEEPMQGAHKGLVSVTSPLKDVDYKILKVDVLQVDVAKMEERTYNLRVLCMRGCGVFVKLARALEYLQLEIVHANLTSVKDRMLNTIFMKAGEGRKMEPQDLREMILEILLKFGLGLATQG